MRAKLCVRTAIQERFLGILSIVSLALAACFDFYSELFGNDKYGIVKRYLHINAGTK